MTCLLTKFMFSDSEISSVAVCAGSGSSVLNSVSSDLLLTGEMSHHEALDFTQKNQSVVLCEHSNTERGFLGSVLKLQLHQLFGDKVKIILSEVDADPLIII